MRAFFISLLFLGCAATSENSTMEEKNIRYVALGDSYTICTGAKTNESWPTILTKHLNEKGIKTQLIANPARNGFTTQDLIDKELSVFDASKANFVTVCIGVNDWVQGVDAKTFRKNLVYILDQVQKKLSNKSKLLMLTIPDFSCSIVGPEYAMGRNISEGIAEFNAIILEEAKNRKLKTVDLFEPSKEMKNDKSLVAEDGLHPSAKEYAIWEELIFPVAQDLLK
jgi:acyl-CoA thioesterase I